MADIKISDIPILNISGIDLFDSPDSFLMELSDESDRIMGGEWNRPAQYQDAESEVLSFWCW